MIRREIPGFFGRAGLVVPAAVAPMAETALLRTLSPGSAGLAPQVTAAPPLDLFHDMRWVSVFHNSWITLAAELVGVLVLRSLWMAWMTRQSWPVGGGPPPTLWQAARRVSLFYTLAMVLFAPWVILLFGLAFSHLSFLFFAAVPPALALAAILYRGAVQRAAGLRFGWRPTWTSVGWIVASFVWLTVAGAVTRAAPVPLALLVAGAAGILNARAIFAVVHDIALGPVRRPFRALVPALVAGVFAVTIGGTAIGFSLATGDHVLPILDVPMAARGEHPVLIAAGLHSSYDTRPPFALPHGYVGWRFSYSGLGPRGRPLPYTPEDTQQPLTVSAGRMADQVQALAVAYREPVTLVAESEGALVARTFLLDWYAPSTHMVDRLITLDMPSGVSAVYFPPRGQQGWGVASGWGLRGLARLLGALGKLRLSVDSGLGREFTDCRNALSRLAAAPPPMGVSEISFQALADMVDPPASLPGIPTYLVNAAHGGLVARVDVGRAIQGLLEGRPPAGAEDGEGFLARLVEAGARPWEAPSLPLTLGPSATCGSG